MARRSDAVVAVGAAAAAARVLQKGYAARIMSRVASAALRRGMHSGNRAWFYVAAGASGLRVLHLLAGRREDTLRIKLHPGETIEIREIARRK